MAVKRLLSIDGGGIRGVIAAEILVEIEKALKLHNPKYERLCDYFDFISGTSTGSIIAAALATGMSAEQILNLYKTEGQKIFTKAKPPQSLEEIPGWTQIENKVPQPVLWIINNLPWPYKQQHMAQIFSLIAKYLLTKYSGEQLERVLQEIFGDTTLGSDALKSNLMIVANNATRGQTWFFVNNIAKKEYKEKHPYLALHGDIPLWKIIRSSAAAPTFFPPYSFKVKRPNNASFTDYIEEECEFIDGGISSYNNPSFQLLLEAVHPEYPTCWEAGADKVLLVSIGTGYDYNNIKFGAAKQKNNVQWAGYVIDGLMDQANIQQNQLMQLIGKQRKLKESSRIGENAGSFKFVAPGQELLSYCRFTLSLTVDRLKKLADKGFLEDENGKQIPADKITPELVKKLNKMDSTGDEELKYLSAIGKAIAREQFSINLFNGFLESKDTNVNQDLISHKIPSTVA